MNDFDYFIICYCTTKTTIDILVSDELSVVIIRAGQLIADDKLEPRESLYILDGDH